MPDNPHGTPSAGAYNPPANGPQAVPFSSHHQSAPNARAVPPQPVTDGGIRERDAWHLPTWASYLLFFGLIACFGLAIWQAVVLSESGPAAAAPVIGIIIVLVMFPGFHIVQPGHTKVLVFFGKYVGTIRDTGFIFANPLAKSTKMSVRVRNFETNELKINDLDGNPVTTAAIVVWTVSDTARASFAVENYEQFIYAQSESALRHVISGHPYDEGNREDVVSLRGSTDEVSQELADEVSARVAAAGIQVIEARISSLAYAPEIAQAMLQRQQAAAVVAARERIVEGAVSMVDDALNRLEQRDIVDLDDERRAAMVSNLLVVLCSDNQVSPVVNTGSLYN